MSGALDRAQKWLPIGRRPVEGTFAGLRSEQLRRLRGADPERVAREFEAILLAEVIKAMRKTIPRGTLSGGSVYGGVYDGLFDLEVARLVIKRSGLGLRIEGGGAAGAGRQPEGSHAAERALSSSGAVLAAKGERTVTVRGTRTLGGGEASESDSGATLWGARIAPVSGKITSGFGYRKDPIDGVLRFHKGLDIAAAVGTPVRAVAYGEVVFAGWKRGSGLTAVIAHPGGITSTYAHAQEVAVRPGQKVAAGEVVARVGESGRTTGPHLHFELKKNGELIDPTGLFEVA